MITKIQNYFENIKNTSSSKEKQELLKSYGNDMEFIQTLKFVYNDYIVTGLSKKKIQKKVNIEVQNNLATMFEVFSYLENNNTGTDKDIAVVQAFINEHEENRQFLTDLFIKNIKVGITETTVNKVFPGLVPEFGVMLAESFNPKYVEGEEFIITTKLDGSRMICIKDGLDIVFYSRQGKVIDGLEQIELEMQYYPDGVYDGELLAQGDFKDSKEQFKETMKRSRVKGLKTGLDYVLYDYIEDIQDFKNGYCATNCKQRKNTLSFLRIERIVDKSCPQLNCIKHLEPLYIGSDMSEINYWSKLMEQKGQEGIMVNLAKSPYETKRVNHLLKVKTMKDVDLRVIGYQEGTGKHSGRLGALMVDYKGHEVKVGSGFSDELREKIWYDLHNNEEESIMGKIVQVQYFEETTNKDGGVSLRFPVFLCIRDDKNEPSYH